MIFLKKLLQEQFSNPRNLTNITSGNADDLFDDSDKKLYIRCLAEFISMRKETLTETFLSETDIKTLQEILCEKSTRFGSYDPSNWPDGETNQLKYQDYTTRYSKSDQYDPTGTKTNFSYEDKAPIKNVMLALGLANVSKAGSDWVITDMYDYNTKFTGIDPNNVTMNQILDAPGTIFKNLIKLTKNWITGGSLTKPVEKIVSQLHLTGYPGYEIKITIPSTANCPGAKVTPDTKEETPKSSQLHGRSPGRKPLRPYGQD